MESSVYSRNVNKLNKLRDQYKEKAVSMEREKMIMKELEKEINILNKKLKEIDENSA